MRKKWKKNLFTWWRMSEPVWGEVGGKEKSGEFYFDRQHSKEDLEPRGILPIMAYTGSPRQKRVPLENFRDFTSWSIWKGIQGNLLFQSAKRPKRGNRCILWLWKIRQNVLVLWFIHIFSKDGAFPAGISRGCKVLNKACERGTICHVRYTKWGPLFCPKWYIKG